VNIPRWVEDEFSKRSDEELEARVLADVSASEKTPLSGHAIAILQERQHHNPTRPRRKILAGINHILKRQSRWMEGG